MCNKYCNNCLREDVHFDDNDVVCARCVKAREIAADILNGNSYIDTKRGRKSFNGLVAMILEVAEQQ